MPLYVAPHRRQVVSHCLSCSSKADEEPEEAWCGRDIALRGDVRRATTRMTDTPRREPDTAGCSKGPFHPAAVKPDETAQVEQCLPQEDAASRRDYRTPNSTWARSPLPSGPCFTEPLGLRHRAIPVGIVSLATIIVVRLVTIPILQATLREDLFRNSLIGLKAYQLVYYQRPPFRYAASPRTGRMGRTGVSYIV